MKILISVLAMAFLAGCAKTDHCQDLIDSADYETATSICHRQFIDHGDSNSLTAWITALSEQRRYPEIKSALSELRHDDQRADAMLIAANYERWYNDLSQAHQYYTQAAEIYRQSEMYTQLSQSLHGLFYLAWQKSDHRSAINYASKALKSAQRAGDKNAEIVGLNDLFTIFQEVGNLGPAQYALNLIDQNLTGDESSPRRINASINHGLLNMDKNQFGMAAHNYDTALAAASGSKNRPALRGLHLNIVESNMSLGRMEKANKHMQIAWEYANPDGSATYALLYYQSRLHLYAKEYELARRTMLQALDAPDLPPVWAWDMHYWAGKAAQGLGSHETAINSFQHAITASDNLRREMAFAELKAHLLSRKRHPYEALFIEYFEAGLNREALVVAEQAKTRSFVDTFIQGSETALSSAEKQFPFEAASDRIENLQLYIELMHSSSEVSEQSIEDVIETLGDRHVISYFMAEKRLFIITISSSGVNIREPGIEYDHLLGQVHAHRENPDDHSILLRLGTLLFPEQTLPDTGSHIFIAPDDFTGNLALASLRIDTQFLVERHTLSFIPSASALAELVKINLDAYTPNQVTIVADSENDLQAANQEALEVGKLLNTTPWIGKSATLKRVLQATSSDILHIATHTGVSHLGPWIRLADRDMHGTTILSEKLAPRLAVLASCASGVGSGKQLWGSLGGLFLSAGTPTVIATLWSVEDEFVLKVMRNFYTSYQNGNSAATALASAQRAAINQGQDPRLWSAFVVLGVPGQAFIHADVDGAL